MTRNAEIYSGQPMSFLFTRLWLAAQSLHLTHAAQTSSTCET